MIRRFLVLVSVLSLSSLLLARGTTNLSTASLWSIDYSVNMPNRPTALTGMQGWWFAFPDSTGHVNYVTAPYTTPLTTANVFTMAAQTVTTSGAPVFNWSLWDDPANVGCVDPARVQLYIERVSKGRIVFAPASYRQWSHPVSWTLTPDASVVLQVPFTPDQWSNTNGQPGTEDLTGFLDTLGHPARVGMTFGGGCFAGHGVNVLNGTARFVVTLVGIG